MTRMSPGMALAGAAALLAAACSGGGAGARDGGAAADPAPPAVAGPEAPALDLPAKEGGRVSLASLRGLPVVVNFWATWCEPCRRELPSLIRLHAAMSDRGLRILAVSVDEDPAALDRFLRETPLPFTVLLDPARETAGRYGVSTFPASFVLDGEGRVVERLDGEADWMEPGLVRLIEGLAGAVGAASRGGG
jgi:peroxiredoxin